MSYIGHDEVGAALSDLWAEFAAEDAPHEGARVNFADEVDDDGDESVYRAFAASLGIEEPESQMVAVPVAEYERLRRQAGQASRLAQSIIDAMGR